MLGGSVYSREDCKEILIGKTEVFRMFFDLTFFVLTQEKKTLKYQTETNVQKPVPFTQGGDLSTTIEGKK